MHWRNSNFQILSFIVGKCQTPDEAYRVLCELQEERQTALNSAKVSLVRLQAKQAKSRTLSPLRKLLPWLRLADQADVLELELSAPQSQSCIDQAERELAFIERLIDRVQPLREYAHLPDHEAFQACQQKEWLETLKTRGENMLASQGSIPWDHMETMRSHPEFEKVLLPHLKETLRLVNKGQLALAPATIGARLLAAVQE